MSLPHVAVTATSSNLGFVLLFESERDNIARKSCCDAAAATPFVAGVGEAAAVADGAADGVVAGAGVGVGAAGTPADGEAAAAVTAASGCA
jgi:hypothetical protein